MLCSNDVGCCKNACFALSCIASTPQGHERLLAHPGIDDVVKVLCTMLTSEDEESVWFAAMYVRRLICVEFLFNAADRKLNSPKKSKVRLIQTFIGFVHYK